MARRGLDELSNSRFGLSIAAGVGRATPPAVGRRVASRTADLISWRRDTRLVSAVRSNQWVVSGETLVGPQLDAAVRECLRHMARCIYDYYHLAEDPAALSDLFAISDDVVAWTERVRRGEPAVFAAPHLSNFDLAGRALARIGFRAQVLSVPDPTDAYRVQNELRREAGLDVTPISAHSLKSARTRLEAGGAVLTGIDRPLADSRRRYRFFGRPAPLPDVHVRLAAHAGAPLVLLWVTMSPTGVYTIDCTEVPLASTGTTKDLVVDVEAVLARAEDEIAERPTQWAMPHAVWPDAAASLESAEPDAVRQP